MERFTISLDDQLAAQFDEWIGGRHYENRSEAVRDLLRAEIGRGRLTSTKGHCVACLSYVYDHHERDLAERLTHLQHEHHELTVATMHAHLDHENCLETVLLRGPVADVAAFADRITAERGVHHGHVNVISVELHQPHGAGAKTAPRRKSAQHLHVKPSS